ncbi:uncharacterized protein EI90DRAFT_3063769 [Cantharellus anzutake]|uniref:uncharacterized protein n=1 Tax=Cantharellus anzutake TaxID=1750568 RepID=UPI0019089577|nr:uncharacterized protein EI90DRAFT_3063769 [Cantharellus anzutake]KAF8328845.1 hypothetical protein EI90DRAFT_3063769 [Cantharellus anzutake]
MPHQETRPQMQRAGGSSGTNAPHGYPGGAHNPYGYHQAPPGAAWMGAVSPPAQHPPIGSPYMPAGPYIGAGGPPATPYHGHAQQSLAIPPAGGGWAGALVPAGAMVPYQQPQVAKLARPKEEEIIAIDRWEPGPDYGIVLDSLKFNILKPSVAVHALLGPTPDTPTHATLVFDLLWPTNRIHLSTEHRSRSWMNGRSDPATFPNEAGVTCGDVTQKLYNFMMQRIDKSEYAQLSDEEKHEIVATYRWNRSTDVNAPGGAYLSEGIVRVDFLGKRTRFAGMVRDDKFVEDKLGTVTGATFVVILAER